MSPPEDRRWEAPSSPAGPPTTGFPPLPQAWLQDRLLRSGTRAGTEEGPWRDPAGTADRPGVSPFPCLPTSGVGTGWLGRPRCTYVCSRRTPKESRARAGACEGRAGAGGGTDEGEEAGSDSERWGPHGGGGLRAVQAFEGTGAGFQMLPAGRGPRSPGALCPQCQVGTADQPHRPRPHLPPSGQRDTRAWGRSGGGTLRPGDARAEGHSGPCPRTCRETIIAKCSHEGTRVCSPPRPWLRETLGPCTAKPKAHPAGATAPPGTAGEPHVLICARAGLPTWRAVPRGPGPECFGPRPPRGPESGNACPLTIGVWKGFGQMAGLPTSGACRRAGSGGRLYQQGPGGSPSPGAKSWCSFLGPQRLAP